MNSACIYTHTQSTMLSTTSRQKPILSLMEIFPNLHNKMSAKKVGDTNSHASRLKNLLV